MTTTVYPSGQEAKKGIPEKPAGSPEDRVVRYEPGGPAIAAFHADTSFLRGIMGPIGSGKSTACVMEILSRAQEQRKSPNGQRKTRWAIIRNSYPELKTTTLKTWAQWCPSHYGRLTMDSPIRHYVNSSELEMEILFLALDRPEDVKKLLSLELTGAWINEAREIPKAIVDGLTGRVGRYPSVNDGGCTWSGIIMDTNPPDDQSWWYALSEGKTPEDWRFFKQPGGRSPHAENLHNLIPNYYKRICAGKDPEWIQVYVDGEYGYLVEGKPVYASAFRDSTHVPVEEIEAVEGCPLLLAVDFGLTPAAVIGQKLPNGRWLLIDELITDNCGIIRFAELLTKFIAERYPDFTVDGCWCDPAGTQKSQIDERSALEIMNLYTPWKWKTAPTNLLGIRIEAVIGALNRLVDGFPGLCCSRRAKTIRKGFSSGYHYKLIQSGDGTQTHSEPNKNKYSHPHDAVQYLLTGGGEHNVVMGRANRDKRRLPPKTAEGADYNPLDGIADSNKHKLSTPPWRKKLFHEK